MKKIFSSRKMIYGIITIPLALIIVSILSFSGKTHKSELFQQGSRDFFKAIIYCRASDNIIEDVPMLAKQSYYYGTLDAGSRYILFSIQDSVLDIIERSEE